MPVTKRISFGVDKIVVMPIRVRSGDQDGEDSSGHGNSTQASADPVLWTSDGHISSACLADRAVPVFDRGCAARTTSWASWASDWEQKAK